jgi:hypothetical protein
VTDGSLRGAVKGSVLARAASPDGSRIGGAILLCGIVPLAWVACSLVQLGWFPGDEYAVYILGSAAGSWVMFFLPAGWGFRERGLDMCVAFTGGLVMLGAGALLVFVRARALSLLAWWLVCSTVALAVLLVPFSSVHEAVGKNGSWAAYVLTAASCGAYGATLLALVLARARQPR